MPTENATAHQTFERAFLSGPGMFSSFVSGRIAELKGKRLKIRELAASKRHCPGLQPNANTQAEHLREIELLIVAAERMAEVRSREHMFCALHELLANLLGTECFALLERAGSGWRQVAVCGTARGLSPEYFETREGLRFTNALPRAPHQSGPAQETKMKVPLLFGRAVVGLLVIYTFLPQKGELGEWDRSLLQLIQYLAGAGLVAFAV